jgi:hypothetical protein
MEGMRRNKGLTGLALVAILALMLSVTVGTAATAAGGSAAEIAKKKKCKKKKASSSKKKKKCKKKKKKAVAPVVRATLTWSNGGANDVDMDLFVFDANGNRAGNGSDAIPQSTLSSDLTGPAGSETFTDLAPKPLRPLSFGVCYQVGGSVHTDFTITYVTADGVSHTDTKAGDDSPGSSFHYDYPGGPPIPAGYCPD